MFSLVRPEQISRDPRKLAFLNPKMPARTYKKRTDEYYRLICIRILERMAGMNNEILLPASCVHHRRRDPERRLLAFGKNYYVFSANELTEIEWMKYRQMGGERYEIGGRK